MSKCGQVFELRVEFVERALRSTNFELTSSSGFFRCEGSNRLPGPPAKSPGNQSSAASFLLTVFSDYLQSFGQNMQCSSGSAAPSELFNFAKSQVDYILGDNPRGTSYMVGYGSTYPEQVHHRTSSIVSIKVNDNFVSCRGGYATWFNQGESLGS
ncbi:Endoglucanase 6 [Platanthera guangdongensis]|uniref:Endoglucanase n=1 Tax=Platanthera guangdongensis TaxID=2320717 RepID=A0ABR2LLJ6_9ASPA